MIERERHDTVCAEVDLYVYGPPGADQMQFSNDGVTYSTLEPFSNHAPWTLSGSASSVTTVHARVRDGGVLVSEASDTIYLGPDFPAPSDLDLPPQTVSSTETHVACDTITAPEPAGDFTVSSTGDLTLHAGNRVILEDGFSVESGGSLTVIAGGL